MLIKPAVLAVGNDHTATRVGMSPTRWFDSFICGKGDAGDVVLVIALLGRCQEIKSRPSRRDSKCYSARRGSDEAMPQLVSTPYVFLRCHLPALVDGVTFTLGRNQTLQDDDAPSPAQWPKHADGTPMRGMTLERYKKLISSQLSCLYSILSGCGLCESPRN